MKRVFFIVWAAALCSLTTYAQQANIYASGLSAATPGTESVDISYFLNTDATAVAVNFINPATGAIVATVPVTDMALLTKGAHTATVPFGTTVPSGTWKYSVTATATANMGTEPVKVTAGTEPLLSFAYSRGIAVDNNLDSPFFGRIYVASSQAGTAAHRTVTKGVYVLGADLSDITGQGNTGYTGGEAWTTSASSLMKVAVGPDGKVYMNDWTDGHSGIWVMNPANPSANFTEVLGGTRNVANGAAKNANDEYIHGSISSSCWVTGTGDNMKLYSVDEDYQKSVLGLTGDNGVVLQYNIGTSALPYTQAPVLFYNPTPTSLLPNWGSIVPDGKGGWWICQSRAKDTDDANHPSLTHLTAAGIRDYEDVTGLLGASLGGAIAVTEDGARIAVGGTRTADGANTNQVSIYNVTFDENGVPSLNTPLTIQTTGPESSGVQFDKAGNLYVLSGNNTAAKTLSVYALPKAENTFTTPAPQEATITVESIPLTPTLTTLFTKTGYTWNTGNASRDIAVYDGNVYAIDNAGKIHVIDGTTGEENSAALITNTNLQCFSIASDGAGKLYVPSNNTAGSAAFGITTVDLLNANAVTALTYAGTGTVGDNKRTDYIEAYRVNPTTTYIAGPSTNTTPQLRIWATDGTTVTVPIVSSNINYDADQTTLHNNNTGGDVTFIDATHLITTGQSNTPKLVTIDPAVGTASATAISGTAADFGGSSYFVLGGVPYLVLPNGGLGAIKIYDFTDPAAPEEVASAPAIGSASNATIHVGIDAFVSGNTATIYVWSPNNGLAVHKFTLGGTNIPSIAKDPIVTITVKLQELEIKTDGAQLAGYALYGIDGRLVRSGKAGGTSASIATGSLPQGVYVLQVSTSEGVVAKKFMKR